MNLLVAALVFASAPAEKEAPLETDFAAVPTATFGSDEGFGTGGVATVYWRDGEVLPYNAALTFNVFITTRLIQAHRVRLDLVRPKGIPLRVFAQAGYFSTVTQNFCGYGNAVTCDPELGTRAALRSGAPSGSERFSLIERKHHQMRFIRLYSEVLARYMLRNKPGRLEVFGGWRGNLYIPGEIVLGAPWFKSGPYEGSQWAAAHPDGEAGFSSVLQLGLALDDRDAEFWPQRGYFSEVSVRAALPVLGSRWFYGAANASTSIYARAGPVVFAQRLAADVIVGDAPTEDMARLGGLTDFIAFGGSDVGRGIREHRVLGKAKFISQSELRVTLGEVDAWDQNLRFALAGFVDGALVGFALDDWRGDPFGAIPGFGVGYRMLWNKNFAVRLDVGFSYVEQYEPRVYIRVGDPF